MTRLKSEAPADGSVAAISASLTQTNARMRAALAAMEQDDLLAAAREVEAASKSLRGVAYALRLRRGR